MRAIWWACAAACVALTGCDPAGPAVEVVEPTVVAEPQRPPSQRISAADCPAPQYEYLVGQPIEQARAIVQPVVSVEAAEAAILNPDLVVNNPLSNVRVLGADEYITRDYDGSRMTVTTIRKDGDEVVGRVFCG
ncbi:MAG: hypothetical protein AAGF71_15200 [Pseudomonadota bacterium]